MVRLAALCVVFAVADASLSDAPDVVAWLTGIIGPKAAKWATFIAFVVWFFSNFSQLVNGAIAWAVDNRWRPPAWLLKTGAVLNVLSNNLDKAWRFLRGYRGPAQTLATLPKAK